jgi:hypothetical protein
MIWVIDSGRGFPLNMLCANLDEAKAWCSFEGEILGDNIDLYEWIFVTEHKPYSFWGCYDKTKPYRDAVTKSRYGDYAFWTIREIDFVEDHPEWVKHKIKEMIV